MTKRDPQSPAAVLYSDRTMLRGPAHATATGQCKRCKQERPFYVFVAPDPHGVAQWRADDSARTWEATHPCAGTNGGIATKLTRIGLLSTLTRQHGGAA